jgi:hypothetical protein
MHLGQRLRVYLARQSAKAGGEGARPRHALWPLHQPEASHRVRAGNGFIEAVGILQPNQTGQMVCDRASRGALPERGDSAV